MPADGRGTSGRGDKTMPHADGDLGHTAVLKKKRAAIEKLREQNDQLKTDLFLLNKFSVRPGDPFAQQMINKLQDDGDVLARKIVLEMRKLKMHEQTLGSADLNLTTTRKTAGGIFRAQDEAAAIQKQIMILENRLEKQYIKYNEAVTHTKKLRVEIDNLRRERMMFMDIDKTLERDLVRLKKEMAGIIISANSAFEAKEKAQAETAALKLVMEKEQASYEEEWRELTHIIEEDKRERDRVRAQELAIREKETIDLLKAGQADAHMRGRTPPGGSSSMAGTARTPRGKAEKSVSFNKSSATNVAAEKVQQYGEAFAKIQKATGIEHIDDLVNSFLAAEDQNYTLFNYVQEVNAEVEKLEDEISAIRAEIQRYKVDNSVLEAHKDKQAEEVERKMVASEARGDLYERKVAMAHDTLAVLKGAIGEVFAKSGCATPSIMALLGEGGITETNLMSYLSILEQRITELMTAMAAKGGQVEAVTDALVPQPMTANMATRVVIEPPSSHELDEDGNEMELTAGEEPLPLSREKLEDKVKRSLVRKLDTAIKVKAVDNSKRNTLRR